MEKILFSCTNSPLVLVSPLFKKLRKEGWTLIREERLREIMAWYGGGGGGGGGGGVRTHRCVSA